MPIIIDPAMRAKAVDMLRQGERPALIA